MGMSGRATAETTQADIVLPKEVDLIGMRDHEI